MTKAEIGLRLQIKQLIELIDQKEKQIQSLIASANNWQRAYYALEKKLLNKGQSDDKG